MWAEGEWLDFHVAPLAGAWIEISSDRHAHQTRRVAPLAGAWIEILLRRRIGLSSASHPSRVRGLKLAGGNAKKTWIVSHPSRVRGLKLSHCETNLSQVAYLAGA